MAGELAVDLTLKVKARSVEDAAALADMIVDELRDTIEKFADNSTEEGSYQTGPDLAEWKTIVDVHGDFSAYLESNANDDWMEDEYGEG